MCDNSKKLGEAFSGGSEGGRPGTPATAQNLIIFMQFLWKFGKIVCWRLLRVSAPSYGELWILPWL